MPRPFLIFSKSDYWSRLSLESDLDLRILKRQGISWFSRIRVNVTVLSKHRNRLTHKHAEIDLICLRFSPAIRQRRKTCLYKLNNQSVATITKFWIYPVFRITYVKRQVLTITSKVTLTSTPRRYTHLYHKNKRGQWTASILAHTPQFFSCLFVKNLNMFVVHISDLK